MAQALPAGRIGRRQRQSVLLAAGLLLFSGLGWLYSHYWLVGPLPGLPHASEAWWLRLHGAAVFVALLALGSLLPGHVARGLGERKRRASGVLVLGGVAMLAASGYGLYYLSGEQWRNATAQLHWIGGLLLVPAVMFHIPQLRRVSRLGSLRLRPGMRAGAGKMT